MHHPTGPMTGGKFRPEESTMSDNMFLPVPRQPLAGLKLPDPDWLNGLVDGAGAGVHTVRGLGWTVGRVIADLEDGRPGGKAWKQAMADDAAAMLADKPPKVWAVEKLLAGDVGRWAHASAQARTAVKRRDALVAKVRAFPGLAEAARTRLDAETEALARKSEEAYRAASTGMQDDRAEAWTAFAAAKAHRSEAARCRELLHWISQGGRFEPQAWEGSCFATPESAGFYLAAEGLLEGKRRFTIPGTFGRVDERGMPVTGVTWPPRYDPFTALVGADTARAFQARLGQSPAASEGVPAIF